MDDVANDVRALGRMVREWPVQTLIFTFGLPLFVCLQVLNVSVHGGSFLRAGGFAVVALACSVQLTRYQVSVYRLRTLSRGSKAD